jgi:hypothetical protein
VGSTNLVIGVFVFPPFAKGAKDGAPGGSLLVQEFGFMA